MQAGYEIPVRSEHVEHGAADIGIVGKDVLAEQSERDVYELLDLGFGPCRMVFATVAAFAGFAGSADAALTIDLRLPNGAKRIETFLIPGEKFLADVWATVSGTSTDLANSYGLSSVNGSIVSQGPVWVNVAGKKGDIAQYKGGVKTTALNPFANPLPQMLKSESRPK